jgi:intracellular sulfur oxidation DsrE/DsrF family protein
MNDIEEFGDQILGAFVDGEIDAGNRDAIIQAMDTDPEVRERVYRLRRAKDLMKLGFGEARPPSGRDRKPAGRSWTLLSTSIAASITALAISFGAGMLVHQYYPSRINSTDQMVASSQQQQTDRILLHVRESDPELFAETLVYAEQFLKSHTARGQQIDVVAHAAGLDLMRADVSPLRDQILYLISEYDNVHFIACASAISLLQEQGIKPDIINGVGTDTTAFDHIVDRLQTGNWTYIRAESLSET